MRIIIKHLLQLPINQTVIFGIHFKIKTNKKKSLES